MRVLIFLSLVTLLLSSCSDVFSKKKVSVPKNTYNVTPAPLVIGEGDIITITSFTEKLPSGEFTVSGDGLISYPFAGQVKVLGKKTDEIQKIIISRLKDGYFRNPVLYVGFKKNNSQTVTIFGQVKTPGNFQYEPKVTVLQALAKSGGLTQSADKEAITIMRTQSGRKLRIRVSITDITEGKTPNFSLLPGDIIIIPERFI
ncbi:MAG: polysaccharide export protein [Deltaproteobacteria bacterium]|nr:polysaccharide export protein [Deltaproteobacteria bacterium]